MSQKELDGMEVIEIKLWSGAKHKRLIIESRDFSWRGLNVQSRMIWDGFTDTQLSLDKIEYS